MLQKPKLQYSANKSYKKVQQFAVRILLLLKKLVAYLILQNKPKQEKFCDSKGNSTQYVSVAAYLNTILLYAFFNIYYY